MTPRDLLQARHAMRLSQEALALWLGVHKLTISHWETGRAQPPGYLPLALQAIHRAQQGE